MNIFQTILLFVFGIIAVVAVLIFSGILPGFRSAPAGSGGTIVLWGTTDDRTMDKFITDFNGANKFYKLVYVGKNPAAYQNDLTEALARGQGPDLFYLATEFLAAGEGKVYVIPFNNYPKRNFQNTFADGAEILLSSPGVVALPIGIDPLVMYYNKDLLATAGWVIPPVSWSDFLDQDKSLTKKDADNNILQSALPFGEFANVNNAKAILLSLTMQAGNPVTLRIEEGGFRSVFDQSYGVTPAPAVAALNYFLQFSNPIKTTYAWNKSLPEARSAFVAGTLATYFGFSSELPLITAKNPHLDFDVALLPQRDQTRTLTYGNLLGLAVAKSAKNLTGAVSIGYLLSSADWGGRLAELNGLVPARRDLLAQKPEDPLRVVFYRAALAAKSWPDTGAKETNAILAALAGSVQSGLRTPEDAVKMASQSLDILYSHAQ